MKKGLSILFGAILLLGLSMSTPVWAGSINAIVNGKSYHMDSTYDWNENNTGLGIEYEFAQKSAWKKVAMANGFRDSANEMSYMAGAGLHRRLYETDRLGGCAQPAGRAEHGEQAEDAHPIPVPYAGTGRSLSSLGCNRSYP